MVFYNTNYNLKQLAPRLVAPMPNVAFSGESLTGLVNLLSDGLEHPLLIVKDRAITLSTISIRGDLLGDIRHNRDRFDRLITDLKDIARNPPYHPILRLGERASFCISLLPSETVAAHPEVAIRQEQEDQITRIIQQGYNTGYRPNIFWAADEEEFKKKLVEHTHEKGNNIHYILNIYEVEDCLYSNVLKTCLIHPKLASKLKGRENDHGSILRSFERILHEITHGLVDELQEDTNVLSFPLEEYIVSMAGHQLTADYANEIAGEDITPEQYTDFLVSGRVTFLSPRHEERKTVYFVDENRNHHEQIARYFMSKLNSREGLRELNVLGD
ncbi:hypothetical protein ACFL6Q_02510 [Candidatus Neomarinimicrobiota bacterium]